MRSPTDYLAELIANPFSPPPCDVQIRMTCVNLKERCVCVCVLGNILKKHTHQRETKRISCNCTVCLCAYNPTIICVFRLLIETTGIPPRIAVSSSHPRPLLFNIVGSFFCSQFRRLQNPN
mmetsp:Transcript_17050/g.20830  ORF Transcript_17050/g.20830 Transcript_17050/m.20830 type:complete len:121 (+) Transcript_17050:756-1118(+)